MVLRMRTVGTHLYLQALIAGGEQNTGADTSTEAHLKILILNINIKNNCHMEFALELKSVTSC